MIRTCQGWLPYPRGGRCNAVLAEDEGALQYCPTCLDRELARAAAALLLRELKHKEVAAAMAECGTIGPLEVGSGVDARNERIAVEAEGLR